MSTFSLKGILSLDGSRWKGGLDAAQRQTKGFAKTFSITFGSILKAHLITAIKDAFLSGYHQVMNSLDRAASIRDRATRIGVSPERMQALDYAARQSGATGEQVVAAVKGLAKTLQRAREMTVDPVTGEKVRKDQAIFDTLKKFNLTTRQIDELSPAVIFQAIAENVRLGANQANRSADLQKLMEEAGDALVPMMLANLPKTIKEAHAKGVIASTEGIMKAAGFSDYKTQEEEKAFARAINAGTYGEDTVQTAIDAKSAYDTVSLLLMKGVGRFKQRIDETGVFYSPGMDAIGLGSVSEKLNELTQSLTTTGIKIKEE